MTLGLVNSWQPCTFWPRHTLQENDEVKLGLVIIIRYDEVKLGLITDFGDFPGFILIFEIGANSG